MFDRIKELLHPNTDLGLDNNYESVSDLPIDVTPHDDSDASNPENKGE